MIDPVRLGDHWIDRAKITALLRIDGKLLVFFGGGRTAIVTDEFSDEEIEELTRGPSGRSQ